MTAYLEIHPDNPQSRLVDKVVDTLRRGGLIAYPTDSGYALACTMGNKEGLDRIRSIRQLGEKHNFTLVAQSFAQVGPFVIVGNSEFRLIKSLTPGPYTFILVGTKEVPRMSLNPKKHTVGIRIPDHKITQAIVAALGEPVLSSTLLLPGQEEPLSEGWVVRDEIGHLVDVVVEGPVESTAPTTVIELLEGAPVVVREGAGPVDML
ncbi:L-threonylcarbamoyladenylate synthase [Buchananella felis]|uniref:L-threonylcarbamoyladenylate synthase n=1 Tax=Buchananella felis TaxID=3231492 RepID=UPI003527ED21